MQKVGYSTPPRNLSPLLGLISSSSHIPRLRFELTVHPNTLPGSPPLGMTSLLRWSRRCGSIRPRCGSHANIGFLHDLGRIGILGTDLNQILGQGIESLLRHLGRSDHRGQRIVLFVNGHALAVHRIKLVATPNKETGHQNKLRPEGRVPNRILFVGHKRNLVGCGS